jgi:hypothetical protein
MWVAGTISACQPLTRDTAFFDNKLWRLTDSGSSGWSKIRHDVKGVVDVPRNSGIVPTGRKG